MEVFHSVPPMWLESTWNVASVTVKLHFQFYFKLNVNATHGYWLLHWTVQTSNISLTEASSIRQHRYSRNQPWGRVWNFFQRVREWENETGKEGGQKRACPHCRHLGTKGCKELWESVQSTHWWMISESSCLTGNGLSAFLHQFPSVTDWRLFLGGVNSQVLPPVQSMGWEGGSVARGSLRTKSQRTWVPGHWQDLLFLTPILLSRYKRDISRISLETLLHI